MAYGVLSLANYSSSAFVGLCIRVFSSLSLAVCMASCNMLLVIVYPKAKSEIDFLRDWVFFFNEYVCCNTPLAIAIEQESRVEQSFGVASLLLPGDSVLEPLVTATTTYRFCVFLVLSKV